MTQKVQTRGADTARAVHDILLRQRRLTDSVVCAYNSLRLASVSVDTYAISETQRSHPQCKLS